LFKSLKIVINIIYTFFERRYHGKEKEKEKVRTFLPTLAVLKDKHCKTTEGGFSFLNT